MGVNRQQTRSVDFKLQIRSYGKVFRTQLPISAHSNGGSQYIPLDEAIIAPKNSDVRFVATSSGASTQVDATILGELATVITPV